MWICLLTLGFSLSSWQYICILSQALNVFGKRRRKRENQTVTMPMGMVKFDIQIDGAQNSKVDQIIISVLEKFLFLPSTVKDGCMDSICIKFL